MVRCRWLFAVALMVVSLAGPACSRPDRHSSIAAPTVARVTASAAGLALDGRPWWPAGLNAYQLGTDWSVNAGCGAHVDVDGFFASLPESSLTRFNAFQMLGTNSTTGQIDFTALDAVIRAAQAHRQLVIPVLTDQKGACEDDVFKSRSWFVDGWTQTPDKSDRLSFQDWMELIVDRWKESSAIAAWELVGEPETSVCGVTCEQADRICPPDSGAVLRSFMDRAGQILRRNDSKHLIAAGFVGGGQCGTAGADYEDVGASRYIDLLEYHDYGNDGVALPGDVYNGLAVRIRQATALRKPLLVAEIGEKAGSCRSLHVRSTDIATKMDAQRIAGTAGALLWAFVPDPRITECTYDIGPADPVRRVLRERNQIG